MKLLFANENNDNSLQLPIGYEFNDAELEVIKAGNTSLIESADKAFNKCLELYGNYQTEITERIRINSEFYKEFQKEYTSRSIKHDEESTKRVEISTNYAIHQLNWWNNKQLLQIKDDSDPK